MSQNYYNPQQLIYLLSTNALSETYDTIKIVLKFNFKKRSFNIR
jgi:hypothetical protein